MFRSTFTRKKYLKGISQLLYTISIQKNKEDDVLNQNNNKIQN